MEIQAIRLPTSAHTVRQPSLTRANRQNASATAAAGENHTGMYSAHARNAFSECASTISPVRHTRLNSMKTSSHRSCAPRQKIGRASCRERAQLSEDAVTVIKKQQ